MIARPGAGPRGRPAAFSPMAGRPGSALRPRQQDAAPPEPPGAWTDPGPRDPDSPRTEPHRRDPAPPGGNAIDEPHRSGEDCPEGPAGPAGLAVDLAGPPPADPADGGFSTRVRERFARRSGTYAEQARLQRGVAWRLARHCRDVPLPEGPCADLGAGTGLLSQALLQRHPALTLTQVDLCPELLARNPQAGAAGAALLWDLNAGLPPNLAQAALLVSSFALQWLEEPVRQLGHWCRQLQPGGWLALAVPTAGSLASWRRAARAAAVPCTALPLPEADPLIDAAAGLLELRRCQRLQFTAGAPDGRAVLRQISNLGAGASRGPRLRPQQLRQLLAHWPADPALRWEVLLLLGQRR